MSSLKSRLLTALIGVPAIILVLLSPPFVITLAVMAASVIGLYEYYRAVGLSANRSLCLMGYVAAIFISLSVFMPRDLSQILVYLYILALFIVMLASKGRVTVNDIGLLILGLIYIPYFLSHMIYIREMPFGNFYIWLVLLGAFLTDTCAYFVGCLLGKHKLCPSISPKKTVEGAVGGTLGCGLSFVLFGVLTNFFFKDGLYGGEFSLILLFVLGLITSFVSQVGDLVASSIKRQFDIKDFGNCLPGHGGILDRCDSIIMVAPTIFLFLYNISIII